THTHTLILAHTYSRSVSLSPTHTHTLSLSLYIYSFMFVSPPSNTHSPQVNEKGVLERMHITLQCLSEFEKVLNRFPNSLWLYFVFMLVGAENLLSHKYGVAKSS